MAASSLYERMLVQRIQEQQQKDMAMADAMANELRQARLDQGFQRMDLEREKMDARKLGAAAKKAGAEGLKTNVPQYADPRLQQQFEAGDVEGTAAIAEMLAKDRIKRGQETHKQGEMLSRFKGEEQYRLGTQTAGIRDWAAQNEVEIPEGTLGKDVSQGIESIIVGKHRPVGADGTPLTFEKRYTSFNKMLDLTKSAYQGFGKDVLSEEQRIAVLNMVSKHGTDVVEEATRKGWSDTQAAAAYKARIANDIVKLTGMQPLNLEGTTGATTTREVQPAPPDVTKRQLMDQGYSYQEATEAIRLRDENPALIPVPQ